MKRVLISVVVVLLAFSSCVTTSKMSKSEAYKGFYEAHPLSVLLMPPINKSNNVDAKEYFHSTLNMPLANAGYYVIPPFLSMEILKKESAYDSELFIDGSLSKFHDVFGADLVVFTVIHNWTKSAIVATVNVDIEYIIKSTKTNEILYSRRGAVTYDASVTTSGGGLIGLAVSMVASAINTAATKYVDVARACNSYTFKDMPLGKYSPKCGLDNAELAGPKEFKVILNSNYR